MEVAIGLDETSFWTAATAARHHFQTLHFLAHGFVEDGVG
jgi:hypothetical protein